MQLTSTAQKVCEKKGSDRTGCATYVEHAEVVDGHHTALQPPGYLDALLLVGPKNTRSQAVARAIRNGNGFFNSLVLDDERYRRKHYNSTSQRHELHYKPTTHIRAVRIQSRGSHRRSL